MLNRVPIPRLPARRRENSTRTSRACDQCRARKLKCDGIKPTCGSCDGSGSASCYYSDSKKDRERTELELAKQRASYYERLLRDVAKEVQFPVAEKIEKALVCSRASNAIHSR